MSDVEIITDGGRRRRWSASEGLRIVEQTLEEDASISIVARRNGVAPNLLYRWRRLMLEGGAVAVSAGDDVTSNRAVRQMEDRIRELGRGFITRWSWRIAEVGGLAPGNPREGLGGLGQDRQRILGRQRPRGRQFLGWGRVYNCSRPGTVLNTTWNICTATVLECSPSTSSRSSITSSSGSATRAKRSSVSLIGKDRCLGRGARDLADVLGQPGLRVKVADGVLPSSLATSSVHGGAPSA
jgi:transposase